MDKLNVVYNKAYDILINEAGALPKHRTEFIRFHLEKFSPWRTKQWRFCGYLGFGGTFHSDLISFYVSCYERDRNLRVMRTINKVNKLLIPIQSEAKKAID